MNKLMYFPLITVCILKISLQISVKTNGKRIVQRNAFLQINCSTDTIPPDKASEIQVDSISRNYLSLINGKCYSAYLKSTCPPYICQCSSNGLWYTYDYQVKEPPGLIDFTCLMFFGSMGTISDTIKVRIIELSDPKIFVDEDFPLPTGSIAKFTCVVDSVSGNVSFHWECLSSKIDLKRSNDTTQFISEINRQVHFYQDKESCTCTVMVDGYIISSSSIQLNISRTPNIHVAEYLICNSSSQIHIYCTAFSGPPIFGFSPWMHSFQGLFIRSLNGEFQGNMSTLIIDSCSYQDAGEYSCIAWNELSGTRLYANKTVMLAVNSAPVISSAIITPEHDETLTVTFYSATETTFTWTYLNELIVNSTENMMTLEKTQVSVIFYNKSIKCDGYIASISMTSATSGQYVIRVRNKFGETSHRLDLQLTHVQDGTATFDLKIVIFCIITFGIFILATTGAALIMKGMKRNNVVHIVGPHEISTVPIYHAAPSEPVVHIYETAHSGYLEVIANSSPNSHSSDTDDNKEDSEDATDNEHDYEEIN